MLSSLTRSRRTGAARPRGQGLVEFALVLPVLIIILLFAIDFGRAYYGWVTLQNASRIGANFAALNPEGWEGSGSASIQGEYAALVSGDWGTLDCPAPASPVFSDGPDTSGPGLTPDTAYDVGDTVKVALTCPFRPITPGISAVLGNTIQLGASSEFRIRSGDIAGLLNAVRMPPPVVCFPVPNVVGLTVAAARTEWSDAGFDGPFSPSSGSNSEVVISQDPAPGGCLPATTAMTVTHT